MSDPLLQGVIAGSIVQRSNDETRITDDLKRMQAVSDAQMSLKAKQAAAKALEIEKNNLQQRLAEDKLIRETAEKELKEENARKAKQAKQGLNYLG